MALGDMARAGGRLSDANQAYRAAAPPKLRPTGSFRPTGQRLQARRAGSAQRYPKGGDPRGAPLQAHAFLAEPDLPERTGST